MSTNPSLISFIASSKRRFEILKILNDKSISQPEIKKITGMYKAHVSRALKELSDKKLIICKNPEDNSFKFYEITNLGKDIYRETSRILSL